jgi:hypothetical protein
MTTSLVSFSTWNPSFFSSSAATSCTFCSLTSPYVLWEVSSHGLHYGWPNSIHACAILALLLNFLARSLLPTVGHWCFLMPPLCPLATLVPLASIPVSSQAAYCSKPCHTLVCTSLVGLVFPQSFLYNSFNISGSLTEDFQPFHVLDFLITL